MCCYSFTDKGKKIIGAAVNYWSLIRLRNLPCPREPVLFLKPTSSYIKSGQAIKVPQGFEVNHEVELGLIISKKCKNIKPEEFTSYISGYCVALDLTAAEKLVQVRKDGNPWTICKGFDTACPVSPSKPYKDSTIFISTIWLKVNGIMKQEECLSDMIFTPGQLISYLSKYVTLEPNDLILTGSPAGVGRIYPGDMIEAGLEDDITVKFEVT